MAAPPGPSHGTVPTHRRRRLDVRVVPHRRRSRLRLRDWHMRTKLGAVLIIPSVAFLVLASAQTAALVGQASSLGGFARQVSAGRQITALIHDLQRERDRTAGEMAAPSAGALGRYDQVRFAAALRPLYATADRSIAEFRRAAAPLAGSDGSWQVSYSRADDALKQLPAIRAGAPQDTISANSVFSIYTRAIDALLSLLAEPSPGADRPELTTAVLRYVQLARATEIGSRARANVYSAARAGRYSQDDLADLADLRAQQLAALTEFRRAATPAQLNLYEATAAEEPFVVATRLQESITPASGGPPVVLDAATWWTASQQRHDLLQRVELAVLQDAIDLANSSSAAQLRETLLVAGAVLAVLLAALVTSVIIGRSIARSLRRLRGQALQVAQLELPEALERLRTVDASVPEIEVAPAAVRSMDEIGEVAEAFVAVHRSAVAVAIEQAIMRRNFNAMFVNLARRSQVLVERQLELLDELEREESDPDQLDNLFKLDHLAARMRRNDESLLVLAGTETSRRWGRPVALSAVMLAAVAEIEQYQRVRHHVVDQLHIVGHAVADLVHLLAELLENATAFSPPHSAVQISGHARGRDGAAIEIADEGLGMSDAALAEANDLLAAPPAADVAASERMGLFVVSHLAARQGVRVQLRAAERGIVAVVWLPAVLIAPAPKHELDYPATRPMLAAVATRSAGPSAAGTVAVAAQPFGNGAAGLPHAGSPPAVYVDQQSPRRAMPTRAEDVIASASGAAKPAESAWWSRQARSTFVTSEVVPAAAPPATPVTGGIAPSGLPMRVPMAQLPAVTESATPVVPAPREEVDPEATGGLLRSFYGGVRRAEAEDTQIVVAPAGARREEEQR